MDRPHGLPRWVALLLVFAVVPALAAVSMVPRGVLRTTVAIQELGSSSRSDDASSEGPAELDDPGRAGDELPGVRAVIKREERESGVVDVLIAVLGGPAHARPMDDPDGSVLAVDAATPRPVPATTAESRGPPSSY